LGFVDKNIISNESFLNSSLPNNNVPNDSFNNNNLSSGGSGGGNGEGSSGDSYPTKKDTDYLYEHLRQFESQKLRDTGLNLRVRNLPNTATVKEQYLLELSRIFSHVRKENPQFFRRIDFEAPSNMTLTNDFMNNILNLKKDYYD
jgi:hypothetical protein